MNDRLDRYAELAVRIGANVAPGQILAVTALVEHAPFVRAVARAGYAAGARCVDVNYVDSHVRKAFIVGAPEELLDWSPPWKVTRQQYLGDERGAEVSISGDPEPNLLADVDGDRVGRAMPRELMELSGRMMLDEAFTARAFQGEAGSGDYRIVHIASHGVFGGSADTSFIMAYDDVLSKDAASQLAPDRNAKKRVASKLKALP